MRTRNRRGDGVQLRTDIVAAATDLLDRECADAAVRGPCGGHRHLVDLPALPGPLGDPARGVPHRLRRPGTPARTGCHVHTAGQAYLDFAARHPRRYRLRYGTAPHLGEPVVRLFTRVLTGRSTSTDPTADALTLWLGLHGLADQRTAIRRSPRFAELVPRLIASLAHV